MKLDNSNQENRQEMTEGQGVQDHGAQTDARGKQMASLLDEHAKRLSLRILKQLENGRARALQVHAQQSASTQINRDGTFSGLYVWARHHRMGSTGLILAALIAGFALMHTFSHQESSDAFLLGADLPPEAFVDRGFEPTLNNGHIK